MEKIGRHTKGSPYLLVVKNIGFFVWVLGWAGSAAAALPRANSGADDAVDLLRSELKRLLSERFSQARVELTGSIRWIRGGMPAQSGTLSLQGESPRGESQFEVRDAQGGSSIGVVPFAAWTTARVALRRIAAGEKLSSDQFLVQEVNIATGQAGEARNTLVTEEADVEGLESRQTILEGSLLTSHQVQRTPDVRRGDTVQVRVVSGDLILSTRGIAQESGFKNAKIKVISGKTKKEFVGELRSDGQVEVKL